MPIEMPPQPQTPQQKADEIFANENKQVRIEVQFKANSPENTDLESIIEKFEGKEVNGLQVNKIVPVFSVDTTYEYFYISLSGPDDDKRSMTQKIDNVNQALFAMGAEPVDQDGLDDVRDNEANKEINKKAPYAMGTKIAVNKLGNISVATVNPIGKNAFELSSGEGSMFSIDDYLYVAKKKIVKPTVAQFPGAK